MLNVGIIGLGVGERHADIYASDTRCNLAGVYDFDDEKLNYLKSKFPNVKIYNSDLEILNDEKIDIVSIASYDNYHFKQIVTALNKKKHVMVEKPICLTKEELNQIIKVKAEKKNLKLSSNLVLRSNQRMIDIKKNINLFTYGEVYYVEADYFWGRIEKLNGWRAKMDYYSIILGAAIHMIDLVMWLMKDKPKKVYAIANKNLTHGTKFKKNSFASCFLEFPNSLIVKISANSTNHYKHMHEVKIFQSNKTMIQTENGVNLIKKEGESIKTKKFNLVYPLRKNRKKLIQSFIDYILKKKEPMMNLKEQFDLMCVCFALEKSLKSNKRVKVTYL